ncbi:selenium cofactor biosynthesis protein YqeC [Pelotomaculum propionicicum]|uniref:selenium cofactor biosynthesis protein YqeC n=1 Tax=Pelotomaculum propionicicum TaxID=258475 RepID=UPI003B829CFE
MKISEALDLKESETISFVGGGGKTSLMFRLAEEIPLQYNVVITTTTKIFVPSPEKFPLVLMGRVDQVEKELAGYLKSGMRPVVGSGLLENNKLDGISPGQVSLLRRCSDYMLVEADGSKGLPLKGHLDYEPVIPGVTTLIVIVVGADILGKTLDSRYVHRPEIVSRLTGREIGSVIDAGLIADLIEHPQGMLREYPPGARVVLFINKIDLLPDPDGGYNLDCFIPGKKIEKVIFGSAIGEEPVLVVLE